MIKELILSNSGVIIDEIPTDLYLKLIEAETKARITKIGLWDYSPQNN